ncbi:HAUS augmin-like complex subunit 3 isoform X2 [Venturia canescens]|uniref:HAUS augmin-like complex subunit 3 isoform X2 n=1 Tax=Venturia canescens TaxID=32260 RepID=UPI001C9D5BE5|nr:HAUS augmin-like complex subunit 3 isoform X2 [Venturia canescens]
MSVTGAILYTKVREILPGLPSRITPEVLNKTCDDSIAQPFFKWFCSNVGRDNYLSPEDARLEKHIKKHGDWLDGEELDSKLAQAIKDCPELVQLLDVDSARCTRLSEQLEIEKDAYKEDANYVQTLEESLKNLKGLGLKLDDDMESEELGLEKDRIKHNKIYVDCGSALEEFDSCHRLLFHDLESLLQVYTNTTEKKSSPVIWTQVPLDIFIKQMDIYNEYLGIYVKRHFGGKVEQAVDSDYDSLMEDVKYQCYNEKIHELLSCQTNLISSKMDKINAKIEEAAGVAIAAHAANIYNNSGSIIPQSESEIQMEIATLTSRREFLEENEELMREQQLLELVRQYARLVLTKMLVNDGYARVERWKHRLAKLQTLRTLTRERGHGYSDLLSMLMQLQLRCLKEILVFIADGRYYLATEYSLSSMRSESMKEEQAKYEAILKSPPKERNVFNKVLISLLLGADSNPDDLSVATKQYDVLVQENEKRKKVLLGILHNARITKLKQLEEEIMSIYDEEKKGVTNSLKPTSYELLERLDEGTRHVRDIQERVTEVRAKIKDMNRKTLDNSFERDTTIMWQRFLTDPEELQSKYDEAKRKVENSHFSVTSEM